MNSTPSAAAVRSATTALLNVDYLHWAPASAEPTSPPVILLHGWPDAPRGWHAVAATLAQAGHEVFAPALRGFGGTRFREAATTRSGQLSALAQDVIEFADALGLAHFTVVGHDWGARAAYISACLWPERVTACIAMSVGWGTNSPDQPLALQQVQNYWYHWYMSTPRGEDLVRNQRAAFTRHIWNEWCPFWKISEDEFAATVAAFDNLDWADVVLHSYRHRWGWAPSDPAYAALETRLQAAPKISVPTLVLHGADDPCNAPASSAGREEFFSGAYRRELVPRCGHFPQREQPDFVANEVLRWLAQVGAGTPLR
jgi:pimeloyl-ACP methyl ester carboxylesterase